MPEDFDEMEKENEKDRPDVRLALVWWVSLRWLLLPLLEVATQAVAPSTRGCYADGEYLRIHQLRNSVAVFPSW
jgi:hypothetical protein